MRRKDEDKRRGRGDVRRSRSPTGIHIGLIVFFLRPNLFTDFGFK